MSNVRLAITILVLSCMLISGHSVTLMFLLMLRTYFEITVASTSSPIQ